MQARFAFNVTMLIVGALLMADRFVFGAGTARWLAFAGGCWAVLVSAAGFPARGRGTVQRVLDSVLALIGAWIVIASLAYSPHVAGWLALGEGAALALLALTGLIAHERLMERAVRRPQPMVAARAPAADGGDTSHDRPRAVSVGS